MDWLDRVSISAIVLLVAGMFVLVQGPESQSQGPGPAGRLQLAPEAQAADRGDLETNIRIVKNLIDAGNPGQAETLLAGLVEKHPYEGEPRMLMGDVFMSRQDPVQAMHAYRQAIDLNPDYLDKKTAFFRGKKLKVAANEALVEIENRLKQSPEDEALRAEKKVIYYLYRRIAGSCG